MKAYYFINSKSSARTIYVPQQVVLTWFPTDISEEGSGVEVRVDEMMLKNYEEILNAYNGKGDEGIIAKVKYYTERVEEIELSGSEVEKLVSAEKTRLRATKESKAISKSLVKKILRDL